ncbi:MAG TPA: AI-2E family transporter [Cyclobacteriaceae bacterium]|jgi:predicted PurR-regulated permease PerM|nr:AI-2E family transporter [Cyclobacteriaceae bacterium]
MKVKHSHEITDMEAEVPFYQKLSYNLVSLAIICLALIFANDIILPILFSILLANLILPLTNYLVSKKFNRFLSIFLPVLLAIALTLGVIYFLSNQIMHFMNDVPVLKDRINEVSLSFQKWFRENTHMTIRKQNQYINDTVDNLKDNVPELVGLTVVSITGILAYVVLLPVMTFLILFYRHNIKSFLISVFKNGSEDKVREVLNESTRIAQYYLIGLMIETTLVFSFNCAGFLILGIKYAVFLALLGALLNLIPYVGIFIANILCMLITLVSSDDVSNVLWVGLILATVQFLDNHFGMPLIVGNKVRINALATLTGILIGGALCGVPGMFLAIPALAVLKVIFDKVPDLQPWGALLGDNGDNTEVKLKKVSKKNE